MLIIADSGSTKTDWCMIPKKGEMSWVQTAGLNPYFCGEDDVLNVLKKDLHPFMDHTKVEKVFFYGSGCALDPKKQVLLYALNTFFQQAEVEVETDLMGAARSLCGTSSGLLCILGTGSSSCLYNGEKITHRLPSLGYILGDEGSGAYLGTQLLSAFLTDELPLDLREAFQKQYPEDVTQILDKVYRKAFPNRYLATLVQFLVDHKNNPFLNDLLLAAFDLFFEKQVLRYDKPSEYPIHFVGSVAFFFAEELRQSASKRGLQVGKIEQSPMEGLLQYHRSK